MAPTWIRLRRGVLVAGGALVPARQPIDLPDEDLPPTGRIRAGRFAMNHPVAVAWLPAGLLGGVAYRHLGGASPLMGGGLGSLPAPASGSFRELFSGVPTTRLAGARPARSRLP